MALWSALQTRQSFFKPYSPLAFAVDFLLNVGAILLATTLYADTPILLDILLVAPIPLIYVLPRLSTVSKKAKPTPRAAKEKEELDPLPKKPFLTTYRGSMLVITCLAILAVDFKIFPRRFAKVETWGTSLMDVGVGSFVFSAGVVAARPVLKQVLSGQETKLITRLWQSLRHSAPLLLLGFVRLLSVKGVDYAEHVSEYGVHWNFFFTLGFLPPFVALFESAHRLIPSYAALAMLLSISYQMELDLFGLKAYILTSPRDSLFSANREGILSFVGYLSIFLAGRGTGMFLLPRRLSLSSSSKIWTQRKELLLRLTIWSAVWTGLLLFTTSYRYGLSLTVSRRLANLPYFLWISAFNTVQLLAFCIVETGFTPQWYSSSDAKSEKENYDFCTSRIFRAYNRNGLAVFLVANLGTGLVNLSVRTLEWGAREAMALLMGYAWVLTGVAVGLDYWDWDVKL